MGAPKRQGGPTEREVEKARARPRLMRSRSSRGMLAGLRRDLDRAGVPSSGHLAVTTSAPSSSDSCSSHATRSAAFPARRDWPPCLGLLLNYCFDPSGRGSVLTGVLILNVFVSLISSSTRYVISSLPVLACVSPYSPTAIILRSHSLAAHALALAS
jgi:hypothetical protein